MNRTIWFWIIALFLTVVLPAIALSHESGEGARLAEAYLSAEEAIDRCDQGWFNWVYESRLNTSVVTNPALSDIMWQVKIELLAEGQSKCGWVYQGSFYE